MSADPTDAFGVVTSLLGFRPEPTRRAEVEQAVRERLRRRDVASLDAYVRLLDDDAARSVEARALADKLTVNETYFFREEAHHAILEDVVLPAHAARGGAPLRILSLGCSSGEEPYGIALTLHERGYRRADVRIVAVDASAAVIARAERAEFSPWSLRNVSETVRHRYFTRVRGETFALSDEVRPWVRFTVRNLLDPDPAFFEPESFDVVFCRNVLIYFTPDIVRRVVSLIARVLRPGGVLFLGHAETSHAGPAFAVHEKHGGFYFTRRSKAAPERLASSVPTARPASASASGPSHVHAYAEHTTPAPPPTPATPSHARGVAADCLALLRAERFDEALALLEADTSPEDPEESEIVRAALLTNKGELVRARASCARVLAIRASNAEAHYLLGLCDELEQRTEAAEANYVRASALDDDFAIPRLRLGVLARKRGLRTDARRLLGAALRLFPHQTERRVLIFGGGFRAEALTRLCKVELHACNKSP